MSTEKNPYAAIDTDTDANGHPVWVATIRRPGHARAEVVTAASESILTARLRHRGVNVERSEKVLG